MFTKPATKQRLATLFLALASLILASRASATTPDTLHVDERGGVRVANAPALNPVGGVTLEAWVFPQSNGGCLPVVDKSDSTGGYWFGLCEGYVRFELDGPWTAVTGTVQVPVGEWSHIAVTFDGRTRRYYVNGVLDVEEGTPIPPPVNSHAIEIGFDTFSGTSFRGDIAEVRLWDHARDRADIRADIVTQLDGPRPGLLAAWTLEGNARDVTGSHPGVPQVGAHFNGLAAPPVSSDPILIPRLAAAPETDGRCRAGEYGTVRLPIWADDGSLLWAYIGAVSTDFYVCIPRMPRRTSANPSFAAIYVDIDGSRDSRAGEGDLKLNVFQDNSTSSEEGDGAGSFDDVDLSTFQYRGATDASAEFYWTAEFRVNRSVLEDDEAPFGLQVMHHWVNRVGDDHGFPVGTDWNRPSTWASVRIDDTVIPRADAAPPTGSLEILPSDHDPHFLEDVTIRGSGRDDTDIALINLIVDFEHVQSCAFGGSNDRATMHCELVGRYAPGRHRVSAEIIDHRGRTTFTPSQTFRVLVDGDIPRVHVEQYPRAPSATDLVDITATARDSSGITRVDILLDTAPYSHTCRPERPDGIVRCRLSLPKPSGRSVFTYRAVAYDSEGFSNESLPRTVVFEDGGRDSDGDGLSDAVEERLCTSPSRPDTDRDGLKDGWEVMGLAFPDGDYIDLPAEGANPCAKDIFLQYDYEVGARLDTGAVDKVVNAFRDHDVNLKVTENARLRPPTSDVSPIGSVEAAFQRSGGGNYYFHPKKNWTHYYAYSRHKTGRSGAWNRYFTFDINWNGFLRNADGTLRLDADGEAIKGSCLCPLDETDPSRCRSDYPSDTPCRRESMDGQARRFMHELGHMIGLGHGGRLGTARPTEVGDYLYYEGEWDDSGGNPRNRKPNYVSIMNYSYNGALYCMLPREAGETSPRFVSEMDFSEASLGNLDERALPERADSLFAERLKASRCANPDAKPVILYSCSDPDEAGRRYVMASDGDSTVARRPAGGSWTFLTFPHSPGIDWNCDGTISTSVRSNINGDGADSLVPGESACDGTDNDRDGKTDEGCGQTRDQTLYGHNDWTNVPSPPECLVLYRDSAGCYPQTADYRSEIAGPDCRDGGGTDLCDSSSVIFSGAPEPEFHELLPGTESCDEADNDGDGEVDEGCVDRDGDGVVDAMDNCPETANPLQEDRDADRLGEACQNPGKVEGLSVASVDGMLELSWNRIPDVRGYAVYGRRGEVQGPAYLGQEGTYPTTREAGFTVPIEAPGFHAFHVRPVSLSGVEGADRFIGFDVGADGLVDGVVFGPEPTAIPNGGSSGGSSSDPDPVPDAGGASGCSATGARGPAGPALPSLVLFLVGVVARRRRQRS